MQCGTRELIFDYEFGDSLVVKITKKSDCDDLLASEVV